MTVLQIITGKDHPILRTPASSIKSVSKKVKAIIKDLKQTLHAEETGVGLAAPQVGISLQIFLAKVDGKTITFINPTIIELSKETEVDQEGCLSLPKTWGNVRRAKQVLIEFTDEKGKRTRRAFSNFTARIVQHEFDHLHGILFIDKLED